MNKINNIEEFYKITESDKLVIFYWNTLFCPDCFVSRRFLPKLVEEFNEFEFCTIDKNSNLELAKHLNIYGVPSFLIFKSSEEIGRLVNKKRKTHKEVKEFIQDVINLFLKHHRKCMRIDGIKYVFERVIIA